MRGSPDLLRIEDAPRVRRKGSDGEYTFSKIALSSSRLYTPPVPSLANYHST